MVKLNKRYQNVSTEDYIQDRRSRLDEAYQTNAEAYLNAEMYNSYSNDPSAYYNELMSMNDQQQMPMAQTGISPVYKHQGKVIYIDGVKYTIGAKEDPWLTTDRYVLTDENGNKQYIGATYLENIIKKGKYAGRSNRQAINPFAEETYEESDYPLFLTGWEDLHSPFSEGVRDHTILYGQTPEQFENANPNIVPMLKKDDIIKLQIDDSGTVHTYKVLNTNVSNMDWGSNNYLDRWTPNGGYKTKSLFSDNRSSDYGIGYELIEVDDSSGFPFSHGLNSRIVLPYDAVVSDAETGKPIALNKAQDMKYNTQKYMPAQTIIKKDPDSNEQELKENNGSGNKSGSKGSSGRGTVRKTTTSPVKYDNWGIKDMYFEEGGPVQSYDAYAQFNDDQKKINNDNGKWFNTNGVLPSLWAESNYYLDEAARGDGLYKTKWSKDYADQNLNEQQISYLKNTFKNNKFYTKNDLENITNKLNTMGNIVNMNELFSDGNSDARDQENYIFNGKLVNKPMWALADRTLDYVQNLRMPQATNYDFSNLSIGNRLGSVTPDYGDWNSAVNYPQAIDGNNNMQVYNPINYYPDGRIS